MLRRWKAGLMMPAGFMFLLITGCQPVNKSESVVYINPEKVISESSLGDQTRVHLDAVRQALESGAKMAETNHAGLSGDRLKQAQESDARLLNNQWVVEQRAAGEAVSAALKTAADKLRAEKGYGLILSSPVVLSAESSRDVSDELVKALSGVKVSFAAVPQVNAAGAKPAD